ncbi:phosphonate ABC transporter, permease protein PhnE [Natronomonas sp. F2-12]|uniref:Phosphonate ABC transporter, permease protein PhnE n=1 Tax=Natronomonas aquatica TaxID=2841590 RepID=A0A9R1CQ87_9EURY|nr:phosphonate ABC transporter, permease protein PhnE [Natronomonas aquatica]
MSATVRARLETGSEHGTETSSDKLDFDYTTWNRFTAKQRSARFGYSIVVLAVLFVSVLHLDMSLRYVATAAESLADLGSRMWPPNLSILPSLVDPLIISAHIAILGTLFSVVLSVPVAFFAANNTTPNNITYAVGRFVITATRSVNVIIWALIFVGMFGPGALAGVMALAVRSIGFIGKLLSEAIEEIDKTQVEAIRSTGSSTAQTFVYSIVPQVLPAFIGIATYRWDSNIRASTVVGFVGGGGIGVALQTATNTFKWSEALVILLVILIVVLLSEGVAVYLRKKFI